MAMPLSYARPPETAASGIHRAFWRWHFYAGLAVMPVLMLMALTGGLYLFKPEIEGALNRRLLHVPPAATSTAPQAWADAALNAAPGKLVQLVVPAQPTDSAKLVVESPSGSRQAVYVNPRDASVLGTIADGGFMDVVKRLHSLDIAGPIFNLLIEVVAGWAIVMVATGVVLWWPRGQTGGVVSVRGAPAKRVFWRDLHAVTGIFAGAIIVFLAATGMPWSAVWGKEVRRMTTEAGWGRPTAPGGPGLHQAHNPPAVPWALQEADIHVGHDTGDMAEVHALDLDGAVASADAAGLKRPYALSVPSAPGKPWPASYMPDKVQDTRTIYLDPTDGRVLADIGYRDFGPAAKTIEWGISVHQGQQYGLANKLVMLAGCIAIWLLGISGLVMWWKRRPKGRLAAPPRPLTRGAYIGLAAVVVPLAIIYPLVGASLIVVLGMDSLIRLASRSVPRKA